MDVHISGYQSDHDVDGVQGNVQTLNVPSSYDSQNHTLRLSEEECGDDGLMLESDHLQPKRLVGHRLQASRSVLSLAIDEECVYAGLQGGEILVWSLETYDFILSVPAHGESVLGLFLSDDRKLLLSCGGDSVVNIWCTQTFNRLFSIDSQHDVGDLFAVVYSSELKTVYCGGQNTSLQWCNLGCEVSIQDLENQPCKGAHRFFDSKGPGEPPSLSVKKSESSLHGGRALSFKREHHLLYAHHGYIYCMILVRGINDASTHGNAEMLLTGSGDGTVKLWSLKHSVANGTKSVVPVENDCLKNGNGGVLSLAVEGPFMYCGLANGSVNIWNLETRQIIRRLDNHFQDVWAMDVMNGMLIGGDASGTSKIYNSRFENVASWTAHEGTILTSASGFLNGRRLYVTGGNDNTVAVWDLTRHQLEKQGTRDISNDEMLNTLAKLVEFKTISARPTFAGECNQGAAFLRRHCAYLGAETKLLVTGPDTNPIVYARFNASREACDGPAKTVLFYGHYDVVIADEDRRRKWRTDPFSLTSLNGFLYGRGVSDNKGPILAALYAAAELAQQNALGCNVVFLVEGEEESGSQGFAETISGNKNLIGDVDYILLANSYWLDDRVPCLTYGLRGVVHANLKVKGPHPDLHSGIDGSALLDEPLKDLTILLSTLVGPKGTINLPGFYDPVLPLSEIEKTRYDDIAAALLPHHPDLLTDTNSKATEAFTASLMHRWREPSLTIHSIDVPSSIHASGTTIARKAEATLSIRIVPNQDPQKVSEQLIAYAQSRFAELQSQNDLTVEITGTAEAWLGDPENDVFGALERAVTDVWGESIGEEVQGNGYSHLPRYKGLRPELSRTDSLDSMRSQSTRIKRIVASSSSRKEGHMARNSDVPTSSTLVHAMPSRQNFPTIASDSSLESATPTSSHESELDAQQNAPTQPTRSKPTKTKPLYIREGGSIPTIRLLETIFAAPAAHLPCGQASDHAHLDNERMRIENLYRSREIFKRVFGTEGFSQGKA